MAVILGAMKRLSPFWLACIAACNASGALIGAISVLAPSFPLPSGEHGIRGSTMAGPSRASINNAWLWLLITGVIGTLAWMISALFSCIFLLPFLYPVALLLGVLIGLFQWAVLYRAYPSSALGALCMACLRGPFSTEKACVRS